MLLHVVDVSHPQAAKQADTVFRILDDLAVDADIPMVTVWNKVDLLEKPELLAIMQEEAR